MNLWAVEIGMMMDKANKVHLLAYGVMAETEHEAIDRARLEATRGLADYYGKIVHTRAHREETGIVGMRSRIATKKELGL